MNICRLVVALLVVTATSVSAQVNEQLLGTWRLVAFRAEVVETGESVETFGKSPQGYLTYSGNGRMLIIMVKEIRPRPIELARMTDLERVELFNTMVAYGGTFHVDGDRITHNVDISWNENWTGTMQVRQFRLDGRRLILTQAPQVGPDGRRVTAVLTWEKVQ